jgi:AcrR family transcriptional regulator
MVRADRRKQLLAVAADIIAANGLAALTMANLSEQANIAKPVVYTHFANRAQVAIALLEAHSAALRSFFETRFPTISTLDEFILAVVDSSFEFERVSNIPIRKITNGFSAGDEVNRAYLQETSQMRDRWKSLLEIVHVPSDQAEIAATIMHDMIRAAVYHFADKDQLAGSSSQVAKQTLSTLLMAAIKALAAVDDLQQHPIDFSTPPGSELIKIR